MSDMTVGQKHIVRADDRLVFGIGRNMSSHVFAKDVPVAYFQLGPASGKLQVVRHPTDQGIGMDLVRVS